MYYLDLGFITFKRAMDPQLLESGNFRGLAVLGFDSDFPLLLTTTRNEFCSFLEIRGLYIMFNYSSFTLLL